LFWQFVSSANIGSYNPYFTDCWVVNIVDSKVLLKRGAENKAIIERKDAK